jgi:hypothetical protein
MLGIFGVNPCRGLFEQLKKPQESRKRQHGGAATCMLLLATLPPQEQTAKDIAFFSGGCHAR